MCITRIAVYEDYIAGTFDGIQRSHMDFILMENPYETYTLSGSEESEENMDFEDASTELQDKVLRVGSFIPSPHSL